MTTTFQLVPGEIRGVPIKLIPPADWNEESFDLTIELTHTSLGVRIKSRVYNSLIEHIVRIKVQYYGHVVAHNSPLTYSMVAKKSNRRRY